jgi:molecular chaperone DnaJ
MIPPVEHSTRVKQALILVSYFVRNATQNEIKEAYRKLAMALHPDRHKGCETKGNQFKEATEAYKVLSGELIC